MGAPATPGPVDDIEITLARPNTGSSGLAHQIAQFVWTIEVFAVPIAVGLLCQ